MSDPSAKEPADPAKAVIDGLEPGQPLADAVERRLAEVGGPVPVDEAALQQAVQSAARRIAALDPARPSPSPRRWPWALAAAAVLIALLVGWIRSAPDLGPGITLVDGAAAEASGTELLVHAGTVRFARDEQVRPRFDRLRIPAFDAELIPTGTIFEVEVEPEVAELRVTEGRVQLVIAGAPQLELQAGGRARFDADGLVVQPIAAAPSPAPTAGPAAAAPAPHGVAGPPPAIAHVAVDEANEIPAILLLLGAATEPMDPARRAAVVEAADLVGSVRGLVPLAQELDPAAVDPRLAPLVWFARGRAHEAEGRLAEALAAYERVPEGHWTYGAVRTRSGRILAQLGEYSGASVHLRSAIAAGGRTAGAAGLALADVQIRDGEPSAAIWTWRKAKIPSPTYDEMRVKTKRLPVHQHVRIWSDEQAAAERILAEPDGWRAALHDPSAATPILRQRLAADPTVAEILAEHRALEELEAGLSTTLDPELTAALQTARTLHDSAAELATKRALSDLLDEIRRALPR